jgi:hypothetical protein
VTNLKIEVGTVVQHPKRPAWGPGKTLAVGGGGQVTVYFRDLEETKAGEAVKTISTTVVGLEIAEEQSDSMLNSLPPFVGGKFQGVRKPRLSLDHAVQAFIDSHPAAFEDAKFLEQDRGPMIKAHEMWVEELGGDQGSGLLDKGKIAEASTRLLKIDAELGFLNSQEKSALKDDLVAEEAAGAFLRALFTVADADAPEQVSFQRLIESVDALVEKEPGTRSSNWPVLTHFPYIANPEHHLQFRPVEAQKCAARLNFDLRYSAGPNWWTYARYLEMAGILMERLAPIGARDFIDVQFFITTIAKA